VKLAVVTATVDPTRTSSFWKTWRENAGMYFQVVVVWNNREDEGPEAWRRETVADVLKLQGLVQPGDCVISQRGFGGVVSSFQQAVEYAALEMDADVVACLHDDVAIYERDWAAKVVKWFDARAQCLLLGFGGATGLGDPDIYKKLYAPHQLARRNFVSNMKDAEAHGKRVEHPTRVACLDGFSQVGRASFMRGAFKKLVEMGVRHHAYDAALGAFAKRAAGEAWMLPIYCHHHGGLTAVGDPRYQDWAKTQHPEGDEGFWKEAHEKVYEELRDVLPIDV